MKKFWEKIGTTEIRNILAVIYIIGVLIYVYVLVFKPVPPENKDLVNVLGGTVITSAGMILSYFFGASKGDSNKVDPK